MTRRRVWIVACTWAVLVVALWASDSRPAVFVLGGAVAVSAAAIFVMIDVGANAGRTRWTTRSGFPAPPRGTDPRVALLRHQIYGAWLSGSAEISDTLVDLLDSRLIAHHHISRTADPAGAAALLTPSLRRLVAGPRRQTATVRELRQILTDIEAL